MLEGCRELRTTTGQPSVIATPPRRYRSRTNGTGVSGRSGPWWRSWLRKYVVACLVCGGLSVCHGIVFIVIYLFLRNYTTSLHFFETIPTYVPGLIFIITGLIFMCLARRRNRYAFLMKVAGGCGLVCALLCVVMTVTTTVIHMNRLQTLHECVYTPQSRTCMCVSAVGDHNSQEAHRFVFNSTPSCEVVHGSLYSCLRALFSFSVLGILLCISCSMLVYQLLSHEKKRKYWEQLELRRRFLHQRYSRHCGCYDQLHPYQLWEMLDYRLLSSPGCYGNEEDPLRNSPPPPATPQQTGGGGNRRNRSNGGHHRSSGWNWLPWPRQQQAERTRESCQERPDENATNRQNLLSRLVSRDTWSMQVLNMDSTSDMPCAESAESLQWRNGECVHVFRSPRNTNCFPPRFGRTPRSSPYGRPHGGSHRRTRSNDGIFHHLNMAPRYSQPFSLVDPSGGICTFSEIPRYLWGPPPPYSQPPSLENLSIYGNTGIHRPPTLAIEQQGRVTELDRANGSISSKVSTPLSERRFVCHNFSSDGITLTIGGDYENLITQNNLQQDKKDNTCIVEVHVPYIFHKKDIVFNTLPARSCRRKEGNPFKSLSNIPLGLPRRLKSRKSDSELLSVIKVCCDLKDSQVADMEPSLKSVSSQMLSTNTEPHSSLMSSGELYQPTLVEVPSEFKSSLVISTSPDFTITNKVHGTQSMPNLNTSDPDLPGHLRRAPSSGNNTSTSQDLGDFDLEDEFGMCSPNSDGVPSLPRDESDSSSSYHHHHQPCVPRLFGNSVAFETPVTNSRSNGNDSDSSSCGVVVTKDNYGKSQTPSSVIFGKRSALECPISCSIRHLHNYHPDKSEVRRSQADRTGNFVVTIKSVNI